MKVLLIIITLHSAQVIEWWESSTPSDHAEARLECNALAAAINDKAEDKALALCAATMEHNK